jgi:hypothetical protein
MAWTLPNVMPMPAGLWRTWMIEGFDKNNPDPATSSIVEIGEGDPGVEPLVNLYADQYPNVLFWEVLRDKSGILQKLYPVEVVK